MRYTSSISAAHFFEPEKHMAEPGKLPSVIDTDHCTTQHLSPSQPAASEDQPSQPHRLSRSHNWFPPKGASKSKSRPTREPARKAIQGSQIRSFGLPHVLGSKSLSQSLVVRNESPWETFKPVFRCQLAGTVIIAGRRSCSRPSRAIAIREYPTKDADEMLHRFRHIKHENVLTARECYTGEESMYALVEDLPLTLEHLVGCRPIYLSEPQLGEIIGQVSLCYICY